MLMMELNKCLVAPISVEKVDISILKTFPLVSVEFSNVTGNGRNRKDREVLFTAETIALNFNLRGFLKGKFDIKGIDVEGGEFNLKRYKDLSNNYIIWKYNSNAKPITFHLRKIHSKNTFIRYRDLGCNLDVQFLCQNMQIRGDLYKSNQNFKIKGNYHLQKIVSNSQVILNDFAGKMNVVLNHDLRRNMFSLSKGEISIDKLAFAVKGNIFYDADVIEKNVLSIHLTGNNIDLENCIERLPKSVKDILKDYSIKGNLSTSLSLKGNYKYNDFHVALNYKYKNGKITHSKSGISISDLNAEGFYTNGAEHNLKTSVFLCNKISARIKSGKIDGSAELRNFISPYIRFDGIIQGDIKDISEFIGQSSDVTVKGYANLSINYENTFSSFDIRSWKKEEIAKASCKANLSLYDFYLQMPLSQPFSVATDTAQILFSAQTLSLQSCNLRLNDQVVNARIRIENLLPYWISETENIYVSADIKSKTVALDKWAYLLNASQSQPNATKNAKETEKEKSSLWKKNLLNHLYLDFNMSIDEVTSQKGTFKNVNGRVHYNPSSLQVEDLSLKAYDGSFYGNLNILFNPSPSIPLSLNMEGKINKVNIEKAFLAFDNFGQKQITDKNIRGSLSMSFFLKINWDKNMKIIPSSIVFSSDLHIFNGSLYKLEALQKLAKFTGEADLENIRFSDINNKIDIANGIVSIPKMHINSSLLSLDFSGKHNFDNEVNYSVDIELSELLSRKRKKRALEEELGLIVVGQSEKIRLPLIISGPISNPNIRYDFKTSRVHTKEKFNKEKNSIKEAFKKERESSLKHNPEKAKAAEQKKLWKEQEKGKFLIEDDEENNKKDKKKKADTTKRKPSPIRVDWEE